MQIERSRFERLLSSALEHPEVKPYVENRSVDAIRLRRQLHGSNAQIAESRSSELVLEETLQQQIQQLQKKVEEERRAAAAEAVREQRRIASPVLLATALAKRLSEVKEDSVEAAAILEARRAEAAHDVHMLEARRLPVAPAQNFFPPRLATVRIGVAVVTGLFALVSLGYVAYAIFFTDNSASYLASNTRAITSFWVTGFAFATVILITIFGNSVARMRERIMREIVASIINTIQKAGANTEKELFAAREKLQQQNAATDKVLSDAILEELRVTISQQLGSSYSHDLPDLVVTGLAEGAQEAQYQIPTAAFQEIERLLDSMPSGSIGIAGQRGAGKSTLLNGVRRKTTVKRPVPGSDEIRDTPVIAVGASAPVQYDARDFILHLFWLLCTRVRALGGDIEEIETPASPSRAEEAAWWAPLLTRYATTAALICMAVSELFLAVALTKAFWPNLAIIKPFGDFKVLDTLVQALLWFLAGFVLRAAQREYHRHVEQRLRDAASQPDPFTARVPDAPTWFSGKPEEWQHLVTKARKQQLRIRYQRNYSLDAQFTAKLAIADLGLKQGTSWSEQRLTLPEIVEEYREFVRLVATHAVVIITIDEIDKISSDEKAQQFVNDIKAIFNIASCFYLITVSDNAMANFARRGLPIRDAFDSAFDEIIRVEYLDLTAAEELLKRRIIGLPLPFVGFCYCFAGGLPRDLIRACRGLFEHKHLRNSPALKTIAESLVREDLLAKLEASIQTINQQQHAESAPASAIVGRLWVSMETVRNAGDLNTEYTELTKLVGDPAPTGDDAERMKKVRALVVDVASYLYYCRTLLDLIGKTSGEPEWKTHTPALDQAARLRRYIGVESLGAAVKITALREQYSL